MVTGRRVITLSTSAVFHLAALGVGLLVVGADAGSAILVDLVSDIEGERVHDAPTRPRAPSPRGGAGRAGSASARLGPPAIAPDPAPASSGQSLGSSPPSPAKPASELHPEPNIVATMAVPGARSNAEPPSERAPIGAVADIQALPVSSREGGQANRGRGRPRGTWHCSGGSWRRVSEGSDAL